MTRKRIVRGLFLLIFAVILGLSAELFYAGVTSAQSNCPGRLHNNTLQAILRTWEKPGDGLDIIRSLPPNQLATGIEPRPCHSHNDYWRRVPLFEALAAGCTSVEADVWLDDDLGIPLVGHSTHSLTTERTLKSLYIDPIMAILESQYPANSMEPAGIFGPDDAVSLVLLLDLKASDHRLWTAVQAQLQPLRDRNWLTYWDAARDVRVARPVTVVASGAASFDAIASALRPDIFFDAPLDKLDERYNVSNSHYASVSMTRALGSVPWSLGSNQRATVDRQIKAAADRGLISRYWGTPSRPLARRDSVWYDLVRLGVGVLNGDDINCMNTILSRPYAYDGTSKTPLEDEV